MSAGLSNAVRVFRKAASFVPAYQKFLKKNKVKPGAITGARFTEVPLVDKKGYIYKYPLAELFPEGKIPAMAYASSGSSGKPTFWFRGDEQEETGGALHELIFRDIFGIRKNDSTLVIVCFSMGVWVAGNFTVAACRELARKGYALTVISPGIEKEDIFNALRDLAPRFKRTVLVGYPPFLMDIVGEARKRGVGFQNVNILTAGDKFSEEWRAALLKLLNIKDVYRGLVSVYGSADAGPLGHETPLSVFIRREAGQNKRLYTELFGEAPELPGLVQYHPDRIFFEEVNGELIFTTDTAAPLVRYNIRDTGNILPHNDMAGILRKHHLERAAKKHGLSAWKLPFLVLKGRTDVAVTFYALNIYPEHIKAGIEDRRVSRFLSGSFLAYNKTVNNNRTQKLFITVELAKGVRPTRELVRLAGRAIVENLIKLNIEFRKLYATIGVRALPTVGLSAYGEKSFLSHRFKGVLSIKGKKPRLLS